MVPSSLELRADVACTGEDVSASVRDSLAGMIDAANALAPASSVAGPLVGVETDLVDVFGVSSSSLSQLKSSSASPSAPLEDIFS